MCKGRGGKRGGEGRHTCSQYGFHRGIACQGGPIVNVWFEGWDFWFWVEGGRARGEVKAVFRGGGVEGNDGGKGRLY